MSYPIEERFYAAPLPRITIPKLDALATPSIPLRWAKLRSMAEIPHLGNYLDGTQSLDRARFRLAYDDAALVVAGWLGAPTHGRDDVVEDPLRHEQLQLLLNPTPERLRWYRIRLRPHEVMTIDAGGEDGPGSWWTDEGTLVQGPDERGWAFAARIPFHLLGVPCPEPGRLWRMNLFRMFVKRQEDNSSWSVIGIGRNDIPERYGELVFGGEDVCGWLSALKTGPRRCRAAFRFVNRRDRTSTVTVLCRRGNTETDSPSIALAPGKQMVATCDFAIADGGSYILEALDETGCLVVRVPVETGLPPLRGRKRAVRRMANRFLRASGPTASAARRLDAALGEFELSLKKPVGSARSYHRLDRDLASLEYRSSVLWHRVRLRHGERSAVLLAETSLRKVFPKRPLPHDLRRRLRLVAPMGGSDAAQVLVLALGESLRGCAVSVSTLIGPDGARLPSGAVETWLVGSVETRRPRYAVDYVGPHPDPLLPVEPFTVEKGTHATLWLTVTVPPETPAGTYRGWLQVTPEHARTLTIPIALRVWGFSLPTRPALRTAFPLFEREIEQYYAKPLTPEQRWRYYEFLLHRRISPSCQYEAEPRPRVEDLDRVMAMGSNVVSMGYLQSSDVDGWIECLAPTIAFLRERGWVQKAYVYGFDEIIPGDGYPKLIEAYGKVKERYPDLPRACTIGPSHDLPKLYGTVDIWIPQTDRFDPLYRERQAAGDELWCYVSMWPRHPFANLFVDYSALEHRIIFWQLWKHGVTGFLYYCINLWSSNTVGEPSMDREVAGLPDPRDRAAVDAGARWPRVRWNTFTGPTAVNGDGQLVYPGPDGGPLSSVRLECVRHGIEDYEMLAILQGEVRRLAGNSSPQARELIRQARRLVDVPPEVCADFTRYTDDPDLLLRTRREVGDLIERMKGHGRARRAGRGAVI